MNCKNSKEKIDLIWGIVLLIISLAIIFYSYRIPAPLFVKGLARTNPYIRLWAFFLVYLSANLIIISIIKFRKKSNIKLNTTNDREKFITFPLIYTIVLLVFYLSIMSILGYTISTIFFLFMIMSYFKLYQNNNNFNKKKKILEVLKSLILSIIISLFTHQIFVEVLNVIVPIGSLFAK